MVKILSTKYIHAEVFSINFNKRIRKVANQKTKYILCRCKSQNCEGKFIRKYPWQKYCQWEMLRRGLIENVEELTKGKKFWENN